MSTAKAALESDTRVLAFEAGRKDLGPAELASYDVLVLNNANELDKVIPEVQRKSVEDWFSKGKKGIVGIHAALVHQTNWPWLHQLGGCDFNSDSLFLKAKVIVDPAAIVNDPVLLIFTVPCIV